MTKRIIWAILVLFVGGVALIGPQWWPSGDPGPAAAALSTAARSLPVHVIEVQQAESYQRQRDFTGLIVASRASDIGFKLAGKIVGIRVEEGQFVSVETAIATLDTRQLRVELEQTKSQLREAMARLQMLHKGPRDETIAAARAELRSQESNFRLQAENLARRQGLSNSQAISAEEIDQSRFGSKSSAALVEAARARLDELLAGTRQEEIDAQEAVVEQLVAACQTIKIQLEDSVLQAPFDGTVAKRFLDEGSVVAAGAPVVRLVEDHRLEAQIGIPVDLARRLQPGSRHTVVCGDSEFEATLRCVLPELNLRTQTRVAIFDMQTDADVRPAVGEIARVRLQRTVDGEGFWLPATAIERGQRGLWSAYVVAENAEGSPSRGGPTSKCYFPTKTACSREAP